MKRKQSAGREQRVRRLWAVSLLGLLIAAPTGRAADEVVGKLADVSGSTAGGTSQASAPSPLDAILGPQPNLSTDAACAELVRKISQTIPREKLGEMLAARKDAAELKSRLGAGRAELQNRLMERAIKIANAKLAAERRAPLMRLLSINSGSADDFSRDVDITLFGGDNVREKALFAAIEEAAHHPDIGLDAKVGAGGLKIDALEATFFPSGNDLPDARYAENPAKHIREYREALQKQRAEVEAYKGSGWKLEVYTKRNPETARVMEFTYSPDSAAVVRHGYLPENGEELRSLLHGSATRRLAKWEKAAALVSPLLQAKQHGEGGDPTKGPIKYAARSLDTVAAYFDFPPWEKLSADDRAALLSRVVPHLNPAQPVARALLDKMASALETARQIRIKKGSSLPMEEIKILERISTRFLEQSVQATLSETAAAMLSPPPLELNNANMSAEDLERFGRMSAREQIEFKARKDADYRRCVSAEAMEDLLMAVVEVRGLDIDPETGEPRGRTGAAVLDEMKRRAPPHLKPVINLAVDYAVTYHSSSWARDLKSSAAATKRLYDLRAEMRKVMQQARTPGEQVLETARRTPPGVFIRQEATRSGSVLGEAGSRMRQRARRAAEAQFPEAAVTYRRAVAELASAPPSYLRQRVVDTMLDLGNISDGLQLVEMYQGGATAAEYLQFGAENLLGRTHWAAGIFVSGLKARSEEDLRLVANEAFFAAAAQFLPGIGQVKAVFDVAKGTLNVTVGYVIQGRNAETADCLYVGPNRTGPIDAPIAGSGTVAEAPREAGFCVLADRHFQLVRTPGASSDHRVVNCAALYQEYFQQWTRQDWDGLKDFGPRGGDTTPFLQAHDELAALLLREAGRTGPLWIPPPGRSAADVVAEMLTWRAPAEYEYRRAMAAIYPLLEQRCRVVVRKVLNEAGARSYRSIFQAEGEDVIEQLVVQRLATDVLTGMTDAWRQRATEQPLARRQIERAAMAEDIAAIAGAVRKGAFEAAVPLKAPKIELNVRVSGKRGSGGTQVPVAAKATSPISPKGAAPGPAPGAVPLLDGSAPVVFVPQIVPLDETQRTSRLRLERMEEKVTLVARAPDSPDDGKVGPGDRIRTEVVFAARDGDGGPIVSTSRVVYDLVLPEQPPTGLVIRRSAITYGDGPPPEVYDYIDTTPLLVREPTGHTVLKLPAGWRLDDNRRVRHGPTTKRHSDWSEVKHYRFGHLHGLEKRTRDDGRVVYERQWDNGKPHGATVQYNFSDQFEDFAPLGGRTVTMYEHGSVASREAWTANNLPRLKMTLQRVTPVSDEERNSLWDENARRPIYYRGQLEVFYKNGKPELRGSFVQPPKEQTAGKRDYYTASFRYRPPMYTDIFIEGEWTFWREDGTLERKLTGRNGILSGPAEYYENGKLVAKGRMEGSNRVGKWEIYWPDLGRVKMTGNYGPDGNPTGTWQTFGRNTLDTPTPLAADLLGRSADYSR
jgi:antitoxin component YwqK of YwqJK toxin-antitoxin module